MWCFIVLNVQVRCWQRPPPPRSEDSQQAQQTTAPNESEQQPANCPPQAVEDEQDTTEKAGQHTVSSKDDTCPVGHEREQGQHDSQQQSYTEPKKPA